MKSFGWKLKTPEERAFYFSALFGFLGIFEGFLLAGLVGLGSLRLVLLGLAPLQLGLLAGLWGLTAYGTGFLAGRIVGKTGSAWKPAFLGYGLLAAVPLLAYAETVAFLACLITADGIGRALRSPARDRLFAAVGNAGRAAFGSRLLRIMEGVGFLAGAVFLGMILLIESSKGTKNLAALEAAFSFLWFPSALVIIGLGLAYKITSSGLPEPGKSSEGNSGNSAL